MKHKYQLNNSEGMQYERTFPYFEIIFIAHTFKTTIMTETRAASEAAENPAVFRKFRNEYKKNIESFKEIL